MFNCSHLPYQATLTLVICTHTTSHDHQHHPLVHYTRSCLCVFVCSQYMVYSALYLHLAIAESSDDYMFVSFPRATCNWMWSSTQLNFHRVLLLLLLSSTSFCPRFIDKNFLAVGTRFQWAHFTTTERVCARAQNVPNKFLVVLFLFFFLVFTSPEQNILLHSACV